MITADTYIEAEEAKSLFANPLRKFVIHLDGGDEIFYGDSIMDIGDIVESIDPYMLSIAIPSVSITLANDDGKFYSWDAGYLFSSESCIGKEATISLGYSTDAGDKYFEIFNGIIEAFDVSKSGYKKNHAIFNLTINYSKQLNSLIGIPGIDGTRNPFISGACKIRATLDSVENASITDPEKTGTGTAALKIIDDNYSNLYEDIDYKIQIDLGGALGTATFKWSRDGGQTWIETGIATRGITNPYQIENGFYVYWQTGSGTSFVLGDYWTFTGQAKKSTYLLPGAPFEEISGIFDSDEEFFLFTADETTGEVVIIGKSSAIDARIVKDQVSNPVDIIEDILTEVGLETFIDEDTFQIARDNLVYYSIGCLFESTKAITAINYLCKIFLLQMHLAVNSIRLFSQEDMTDV